eukprot:jgi/Ulvmu1/5896/UM026_0017.1
MRSQFISCDHNSFVCISCIVPGMAFSWISLDGAVRPPFVAVVLHHQDAKQQQPGQHSLCRKFLSVRRLHDDFFYRCFQGLRHLDSGRSADQAYKSELRCVPSSAAKDARLASKKHAQKIWIPQQLPL